jgi:hypothetical protein
MTDEFLKLYGFSRSILRQHLLIRKNHDVNGIVQPSNVDVVSCAYIAFINFLGFIFTKEYPNRDYFNVRNVKSLREYVAGLASLLYEQR